MAKTKSLNTSNDWNTALHNDRVRFIRDQQQNTNVKVEM